MKKYALRAAFPHTVPVMTGYLFLGAAYGMYLRASGFSFWYPLLMSVTIFGGSLEFLAVSLLLAPFAPLATFFMALLIQARHLFYGVAMLEKYKGLGWLRPYLIFGLTDETFSVAATAEPPADVDRGWFLFFITLLDHSYWVTGALLGNLAGSLIPFDLAGLDFVMTAMFTVIFLEQWKKDRQHLSACVGLLCTLASLLIFGRDSFLLPAMGGILALLALLRKPIQKAGEAP